MKRLLLFTCLLSLTFISCNSDDDQVAPLCDDFPLIEGNYDNAEDFDILNAIATAIVSQDSSVEDINLVQETENSVSAQNMIDELDSRGIDYDASSVNNYGVKNASTAFFSSSPNPDLVVLLTEQELSCLFFQDSNNTQLGFFTKYPDSYGFLTFSKPGISDDGLRAVVAFSETAISNVEPVQGILEGGYYLMVKQGGIWTIETEVIIFVS